ncbi:beta-galactosidase GalA [Paenibacillus psychroresistens]|nr:beta-galactosidase GalA [Paenibacillus psychroresistens]
MREKCLFDRDWKFFKGDMPPYNDTDDGGRIKTGAYCFGATDLTLDDSDWVSLHLPHDYVLEGEFTYSNEKFKDKNAIPAMESIDNYLVTAGSLPGGIGWYRKKFELLKSEEGKRVYIQLDGIYRDSTVYLNNFHVGHKDSGFTGVVYDVTDFIRFGGENLISVRVDATGHEGWWYNGGGIYRHVWLIKTDSLHIAPGGTFITNYFQRNEGSITAEVNIEIDVVNKYFEEKSFKVISRIYDQENKQVAQVETDASIKTWRDTKVEQKAFIDDAKLWSLENPILYRAVTTIVFADREVDSYETIFGVRSIRFDVNNGFYLNDEPVKIKGVCCHQDHAGVGVAVTDRINEFRMEKLKELGCNAYRSAHNTPTPELLDSCDKLGILVVCENRFFSSSKEDLENLQNMILLNRNHPSIILWSLGNEETSLQFKPEGGRIVRSMKAIVRNLDTTRPVTAANCFWDSENQVHYEDVDTFVDSIKDLDVMGFNYAHEIWDKYHEYMPNQPIVVSEASTMFSTRGGYETDADKSVIYLMDSKTELDHRGELQWKKVAENPYLSGIFVWTGFDYRGEPSPFSWPSVSSQFGILDSCGFPKDFYYYYKAWWSNETVLHIFPHWNWPDKLGEPIDVHCFSNCDVVELFLNGVSLGKKDMQPNWHLSWEAVLYEPGTLTAKGYKGNNPAYECKVETTGSSYRLELLPDRAVIQADGIDVSIITVRILDDQGRVVPTSANLIEFTVEGNGKILGVGNGNPGSHESDKSHDRQAFNGLCQLIVQSNVNSGAITVHAISEGLIATTVKIEAAGIRGLLP